MLEGGVCKLFIISLELRTVFSKLEVQLDGKLAETRATALLYLSHSQSAYFSGRKRTAPASVQQASQLCNCFRVFRIINEIPILFRVCLMVVEFRRLFVFPLSVALCFSAHGTSHQLAT